MKEIFLSVRNLISCRFISFLWFPRIFKQIINDEIIENTLISSNFSHAHMCRVELKLIECDESKEGEINKSLIHRTLIWWKDAFKQPIYLETYFSWAIKKKINHENRNLTNRKRKRKRKKIYVINSSSRLKINIDWL